MLLLLHCICLLLAQSGVQLLRTDMSGFGGLCCKSLFALVIKIFPGCRRDFRVKIWGTSSPDEKLTDDLGPPSLPGPRHRLAGRSRRSPRCRSNAHGSPICQEPCSQLAPKSWTP